MYFAKKKTWTSYRDSNMAKKLWGTPKFDNEDMKKWIETIFFRDHPAFKAIQADASKWVPYLGVANNPELYSGIWYGHRIESDGVEYYSAFMTKATLGPNMRIVSYEVRNKKTNELVATVTRSETDHANTTAETKYLTKYYQKGETYKIKVRVKNMVEATYKENPAYSTFINGKTTTLEEMVQYDKKVDEFHQFSEEVRENKALPTHETTIKPGEIATFEYEYTVPEENGPVTKLQLMAQIPSFYHEYGKNFVDSVDDAQIVLESQPENLRIHFDGYYDGSINLTEGVVPGETIWVKYLVEKTIKGKAVNPADLIIELNDGASSSTRGTYLLEGAFKKKHEPIKTNELINQGDYAVVWASFVSNTNPVCTVGEIPAHWNQKGLNHDLSDDRVKPPCLTTPRNIVLWCKT